MLFKIELVGDSWSVALSSDDDVGIIVSADDGAADFALVLVLSIAAACAHQSPSKAVCREKAMGSKA